MHESRHAAATGSEAVVKTQIPGVPSPKFSPDGHWLAYASERVGPHGDLHESISRSGREESRFPRAEEQTSHWSKDGRELFYRDGDKMMAVTIHTGIISSSASSPRHAVRGAVHR